MNFLQKRSFWQYCHWKLPPRELTFTMQWSGTCWKKGFPLKNWFLLKLMKHQPWQDVTRDLLHIAKWTQTFLNFWTITASSISRLFVQKSWGLIMLWHLLLKSLTPFMQKPSNTGASGFSQRNVLQNMEISLGGWAEVRYWNAFFLAAWDQGIHGNERRGYHNTKWCWVALASGFPSGCDWKKLTSSCGVETKQCVKWSVLWRRSQLSSHFISSRHKIKDFQRCT